MTSPSPDSPPEDVPVADWAEQSKDADPLAEAEVEANAAPARTSPGVREVDEADLAEQETVAYDVDDER